MIHKKPTINLLLKIAESYLLNENYDQAMEYLNQALAIDPDDLATRKQIALTYRSSGQITLAIAYLKDLIQETDGKDKELLLELARAYLGIKHYEDSIKIVMNCIDEDPDNIAAHLLLADIEMAKGHLIDAKSTWQLVLAKHPYDFSLRLTYADTAQKWGDYYESERIYRKYLNKAPWSATYSYSLAGILNSMNRRIEAEAIYKKLLRSANNIKRACTELADLHETIKDFPKAIYWAEMALINTAA
jgi:tetratricopeptide (TPR) repeat protein